MGGNEQQACPILGGVALIYCGCVLFDIFFHRQGSSDTVAMTNEEGLFEYCIQRDLLTLGWIHVCLTVDPLFCLLLLGLFIWY